MTKKIWHYLDNQFENITLKSYKKALIISGYHNAALQAAFEKDPANPDWTTLYKRYNPLHIELVKQFCEWQSAGGKQGGSTLSLDQLLSLMSNMLDNWEPRIQVVYAKNTERFKQILPSGHKPFNSGSKDTRITAVNTLSVNIGADAALASVKTDVDKYYNDLDKARTTQSGAKVGTQAGSLQVEQAITNAMQMQYANLGYLMNMFYKNTEPIALFFDIETIREHNQRIFTGTLTPLENEAVLEHTFMNTDTLRAKITGTANAKLYLASLQNGTDSTAIEVTGNHELIIKLSDFGVADYHQNRFITIVNQGAAETTKYLIEIE